MLKNYFKIALRNIIKQKVYSFILIAGLSIAIACCLMTFLYLSNEWSYDRFHENSEKIYRVYCEGISQKYNINFKSADTPTALGPELLKNFPEVENFARLSSTRSRDWEDYHVQLNIDGKKSEQTYLLTDPSFFEIFSFKVKHGNKKYLLNKPNSVVISEQVAEKYFGNANPIGKTIAIRSVSMGTWKDFTVTGVVEKFPINSSLKADFILPFDNLFFFFHNQVDWQHFDCNTYIKLAAQTDTHKFEKKLDVIVKNNILHLRPYYGKYFLKVQPLAKMHLDPSIDNYLLHAMESPKSPFYSYVLSGLTFIILIIASINFVNLSLGRASSRFKEIGIRKVVGAAKKHISQQFLGESLIICAVAIMFGIILAELFLPAFNRFTNKELEFQLLNLKSVGAIVLLMFFITIFSGWYPALLISRFHPIKTLKNEIRISGKTFFGQILIVLQFSLSILLIASTIVMLRQINYMRSSKTLGFDKENLVMIYTEQMPEYNNAQKNLIEKLKQHNNIIDVSSTRYYFSFWQNPTKVKHPELGEIELRILYVDYDFIKTFALHLVDGRDFSEHNDSEFSGSIIITESFASKLNWQEPINKTFKFENNMRGLRETNGFANVIGVIKDFHFLSMHDKITPSLLILNPAIGQESKLCIAKIKPFNIPETIAYMEKVWKQLVPHLTFRYTFFDNEIENYYKEEKQWAGLISSTAMFAIFIACLGVFGLITLIVTNRTKEIGIRKVFGASIVSIWNLLTKEFIFWIIVSTIIGGTVSYLLMVNWLQNFSLRINYGWFTLMIAGGFVVLIVFFTLSCKVIKAAITNPVEALRYE